MDSLHRHIRKRQKNDRASYNSFLKHTNEWCENSGLVNMNDIKHKVAHADNCNGQFKCRQNFVRLLSKSSSSTTWTHKFAQKYGFKGPWDGTSKLIKNAINKLENKRARVANAFDCYRLLTKELSRNNPDPDWEHCVANCDQLIVKKQHGHRTEP